MRDCSLTTESRTEECGIVTQVAKRAPRVCGDDPSSGYLYLGIRVSAPRVCGDDPQHFENQIPDLAVLPAYAGMIPVAHSPSLSTFECSPRMRG